MGAILPRAAAGGSAGQLEVPRPERAARLFALGRARPAKYGQPRLGQRWVYSGVALLVVAVFLTRRTYHEAAVWVYAARRAATTAALIPYLARLAPHTLVLTFATAAALAGGFGRPEPPFVLPLGTAGAGAQLITSGGQLLAAPRLPDSLPRDSLVRPALMTTLPPATPRFEIVKHVVVPGDTAWSIGERYRIGMFSVLWANGLREDSVLQPGQSLALPPVPGTLHEVTSGDSLDSIARRYGVEPGVVVVANDLRPGEVLAEGRMLVVPGGVLPWETTAPTPRPRAVAAAPPAGARAVPVVPATGVAVPRVPAQPARPSVAGGRLQWPARGVLTSYFSGWHPGIDIAASSGTPILAADGGTVIAAGWNSTGYGYRIAVNHGNGYVTTYNHLSAIGVGVGTVVARGQVIGRMGSTGRSTGSHLHFEVMSGNRFVNPLSVLGN